MPMLPLHFLKPALLALCAWMLMGCNTLQPAATLPAPIRAALEQSGLQEQHLGLVAFSLDGAVPGVWLNADQSMQPGSTIKLATVIVALDQFGSNARARTDLLATSAVSGEVLPGPLYLRGGADTDLDWGALWSLLRQLREQGVRHIQGGLVVDRTLFSPPRLDLGVAPFDEAPEFQYNVIPDALYLNGGVLGMVLQSDGREVRAYSSPTLPGLRIDTDGVALVDAVCANWEDHWKPPQVQVHPDGAVIVLQGHFPRDCHQRLNLNLLDRQWIAAAAVRQIWQQLGGQMGVGDAEGATPAGAVVLATHRGRPFAEVARDMMKRSDNPMTRLTYLRLGANVAKQGEPTLDAAAGAVRHWFEAKGIPTAGLVMDNGSGLSRSERITPAQMAAVLREAHKGAFLPELLSSLPVAGVDGTLSRRFKGTLAEGRARLKTGSLRNVSGLAGFVPDAQNRLWVVVAFVNHDSAPAKARLVLDSIVEWVAARP